MGRAGRPLEAAQVSRVHRLGGDVFSESRRSGGSSGQTVNKSCDACNAKKRKCDGGDPCSRCVRRGDGHLCNYSRRRPYTSINRRSRAWRSSTEHKPNKITTARVKPCSGNSTGAQRISRDQREMRCVEASHQLSPDALTKPSPATRVRLSTIGYDAHARLARAQRKAFELISSTSMSFERARNEFKSSAVSDSKPKTTVERLETELKESVETYIIPKVHGLDFETQTSVSSAFPVVEQSTIGTDVGMDKNEFKSAVGDSKLKTTLECLETELKASVETCIIPTVYGIGFESQTVASSVFPAVEQSTIRTDVGMYIAKDVVPIFDDIVIDFDSHNHSQHNEYVASIIPPSHARTLSSLRELEDPISAEDWLEIAAG